MKRFITFFLIFGISILSFSQKKLTELTVYKIPKTDQSISKKNTVSIDAGVLYLGFLATMSSSINYERYVHKNIFLSTGFGYSILAGNDTGYGGIHIPLTLNYIGGKRNNHFEADLGGRIVIDIDGDRMDYSPDPYFIYPILNIGYRYQKPTGGFIYKVLLGIDGLTLGVGYAF